MPRKLAGWANRPLRVVRMRWAMLSALVTTIQAASNRLKFGAGQRVVVGVAAQQPFRHVHSLQRQGSQALLHRRLPCQQANQFGALALDIGQGIEQVKHATALGQQRFTGPVVCANRREHRHVARQLKVMQFRVTTGQIQAVCFRQLTVTDR